jgi:hypothetical protein
MTPLRWLPTSVLFLASCTTPDPMAKPAAILAAASVEPSPPPSAGALPAHVPSDVAAPYDAGADLARIAATYKSTLTQVTGVPQWALGDCSLPPQRVIPFYDGAPHGDGGAKRAVGEKLYYLFAADAADYRPLGKSSAAPSQIVVKESWTVRDVARSAGIDDAHMKQVLVRGASGGDAGVVLKTLAVDKPAGLFVLWRPPAGTPGTDAGWLYGTVAPSGGVTSVGAIAACMSCHQKLDHGGGERLIGPSWD